MIALWLTIFLLRASRLGEGLIVGIALLRRSLTSLCEGFQKVVWIAQVDPALVRTVDGTAAEVTNDFSCRTRLSSLGALFNITPLVDETFRHGVPFHVTL